MYVDVYADIDVYILLLKLPNLHKHAQHVYLFTYLFIYLADGAVTEQ